jgi:hypothetical protein
METAKQIHGGFAPFLDTGPATKICGNTPRPMAEKIPKGLSNGVIGVLQVRCNGKKRMRKRLEMKQCRR